MDLEAVSLIANVVLGGFMWLLKNTYNDLKEQVKENKQEIERVKDQAMRKEDFKEFKQELWDRLDKFESKVNAKLL